MNARRAAAACVIALSLAACATQEDAAESDGSWLGTVTTEGNVTTVVNESGSVWGGAATLVEDLSIGVDSGADPYMFGQVSGIAATDNRIYVADGQLRVIRAYDATGNHLFDFGRQGEGPGEFDRIVQLAVDPEGRVFVQSPSRVTVFDLDGGLLDTWPIEAGFFAGQLFVGGGATYVPASWQENDERRTGFIVVSADGSEKQKISGPVYDDTKWRLVARQGNQARFPRIPYTPLGAWTVLPSGAKVEGLGDTYRFRIEREGRSLIVARAGELPPVPELERAWQTTYLTAFMRELRPDWDWTGPPVPEHLPAYMGFLGDGYGRIWVLRTVALEALQDCDRDPAVVEGRRPRPCWGPVYGFDVFEEEDGRYLGEVAFPSSMPGRPFILRHAILMAVQDETGTIMVKRYRLALPGEE